jgi:hypothetical protein
MDEPCDCCRTHAASSGKSQRAGRVANDHERVLRGLLRWPTFAGARGG